MNKEERKHYGEDISFGIQQTLACWATDLAIDPIVGKKIQDKLGKGTTLRETWVGEFVGDLTALASFLVMQRVVPQVSKGLKHIVKQTLHPLLAKAGKHQLEDWSTKYNIDEKSSEFREKLAEFEDFQADNIAKSAVISGVSVVANVATQKYLMKNTNQLWVIGLSKLSGALSTMIAMLGARAIAPKSMHQLDAELSERYFAPMINYTQKALHVDTDSVAKAETAKAPKEGQRMKYFPRTQGQHTHSSAVVQRREDTHVSRATVG